LTSCLKAFLSSKHLPKIRKPTNDVIMQPTKHKQQTPKARK